METKTANDAYRGAQERAARHLRQIEALLAAHATTQAANPANWGFAGDLGHANELLENVIEFLGGTKEAA